MTETAVVTKPISQAERKALEKLQDEDFALVRVDLQNMANEARTQAKERLTALHTQALKKARTLEDKFLTMIREAEDAGFHITANGNRRFGKEGPPKLDVAYKLLDTEIQEAHDEVQRDHQAAVQLLGRKQHEARRNLLKATVSAEALTLLDNMPRAEDIMREAVQQAALTK